MGNLRHLNINSIKTRVTLFTLGIFVVGIWALHYFITQKLHDDMQQQLASQQSVMASIIAAQIKEETSERVTVLERFSEILVADGAPDLSSFQSKLETSLAIERNFNAGVYIVNNDGVAIASIPKSIQRLGLSYIDRDYIFDALKHGKSTITKPVIGKVLRMPVFNVVVPVRDNNGNIIAALVGVTNLGKPNYMDKVFENKYSQSGYLLLEDASNRLVITGTDKSRIMQPLPASGVNKQIDKHLQGFEGSQVTVNPLGVKVLATAKHVGIAGWLILVALPVDEAFAPIEDIKRHVMFFSIFMTLLVGGLMWWILKRELAPMFTAVKWLTNMSKTGDFQQRLEVGKNDEINDLIVSFNNLLDGIAKRDAEIHALLKNIPDPLWLKDANGVFIACNAAFESLCGAEEKDIVGKTDYDFFDKAKADAFRESDLTVMQANGSYSNEEWLTFVDDGYRGLFETRKAALTDANGRVLGVFGIARDITERKNNELQLRLLSTAIEQSPTSVAITNTKAEILYINSAFTKEAGYTLFEVMGKNPRILQSGLTDPGVYEEMWSKLANGENWEGEFINKRKNGEVYYEDAYISPILNDQGEISHYVAVKLDVTAKKLAEAALHESNKKMDALLQSMAEGAYGVDTHGICTFVNNALLEVLGYESASELVGKHIHELIHHSHADGQPYPTEQCQIHRAFMNNTETHCTNEVFWHKDGHAISVEYWSRPVMVDGVITGAIATFFDITERKKMEEQIRHLALHDALTGLPNRRLLTERISQAQLSSKRNHQFNALLFMDLDNFKPLNDKHGHDAGDKLLIEVANRLTSSVREMDTVARIGGDEFVVVLTSLEADEAQARMHAQTIAGKIHAKLSEPYFIEMKADDGLPSVVEHHCSSSVGALLFQGMVLHKDDIIKLADAAMYRAKKSGRNQIVFYQP